METMTRMQPAAAAKAPAVIEEDDDDDDESSPQLSILPTEIVRPIPQRASDLFYKEAHLQGIPGCVVHAAVMDSHEWHRKWAMQEQFLSGSSPASHTKTSTITTSSGHCYDHEAGVQVEVASPYLPASYAFHPEQFYCDFIDRSSGARNPFEDDEDVEPQLLKRSLVREDDHDLIWKQRRLSEVEEEEGFVDPKKPASSRKEGGSSQGTPSTTSTAGSTDEGDSSVKSYCGKQSTFDSASDSSSVSSAPVLCRPIAQRIVAGGAAIAVIPTYVARSNESSVCSTLGSSQQESLSSAGSSSSSCTSSDETISSVHVIEADWNENECESIRCLDQDQLEQLQEARDGLLQALAASAGNTSEGNTDFHSCLDSLVQYHHWLEEACNDEEAYDKTIAGNIFAKATSSSSSHKGTWLALTKPIFFACLGDNCQGDPLYTLGRMSFDMFQPRDLVCSLQGNFNVIEPVSADALKSKLVAVPKAFEKDAMSGDLELYTYNIVTAFTIEPNLPAWPNAPNKDVTRRIRGLMTVRGYMVPDPRTPGRHSVWITGGGMEPNDDPRDVADWKRLFGTLHPPEAQPLTLQQQAKFLAAKFFLGAQLPRRMDPETGSLEYKFDRPLGGHGVAYVDTLYTDESLRIVRGHKGSLFVFSRMGQRTSLLAPNDAVTTSMPTVASCATIRPAVA